MSKIRICADSTCDLSPELIEKYNITITPLQIFLGDKDYTDQKDIFPQTIYDYVPKREYFRRQRRSAWEHIRTCSRNSKRTAMK